MLKETVHQSTLLESTKLETFTTNMAPTTSNLRTFPHSKIPVNFPPVVESSTTSSNDTKVLCSSIPVISSVALTMLPPNVKAIPLNMTAEDLNRDRLLNSNSLMLSLSKPPTSVPVSIVSSSVKTSGTKDVNDCSKSTDQATIPVNIPVNLLNQIMDGDITIHTLPSKSKDAGSSLQTIAGIRTEMGTIPLIPVTGEGGLQLIPLNNTENVQSTDQQSTIQQQQMADRLSLQHQVLQTLPRPTIQIPTQNLMHTASSPMLVPPQSPYPLAEASLSMLAAHHGGFDVASAILAGRQQASVPVNCMKFFLFSYFLKFPQRYPLKTKLFGITL